MKTEIVFNTLLKRAKEQGVELTHLKVQKLLYFLHGYYLAKTDKPLLDEHFRAWQYGPVIESLYGKLKDYGASQINHFIPVMVESKSPEPRAYTIGEKNENFWEIFELVWSKYGSLSGHRLSVISHEKGSPWDLTPRMEKMVDDSKIKEYFLGKLKEHSA